MKYEEILKNTVKVKKVEKNKKGRDYIVGDIHGMYSNLEKKLKEIGFNKEKDRLFSVGDLVDRGEESFMVKKYLKEKWFFPVRGNHDEFVLRSFFKEDGFSNDRWKGDINGGSWFFKQKESDKSEIANLIKNLPISIELETDKGVVVIIHACIPLGHTWEDTKFELEGNNKEVISHVQWNRDRVSDAVEQNIPDIYKCYVGHTVVPEITELSNTIAVDTGSGYENIYSDLIREMKTNYKENKKSDFKIFLSIKEIK